MAQRHAATSASTTTKTAGSSPVQLKSRAAMAGVEMPPTGYDAQRQAVSPGGSGKSVTTLGGTFNRKFYKDYAADRGDEKRRGAHIHITFTPSEGVDAEDVGLTQTVTCKRKKSSEEKASKYYGGSDKRKERATSTGANIDREEGYDDPVFGVPNDAVDKAKTDALQDAYGPGKKAGQQKTVAKGDDGFRNGSTAEAAWMEDKSKLAWQSGDEIQTDFEVTAVCMGGDRKGVYLGSASWGYKVKSDGTIERSGLELVSLGAPTTGFNDAAEKWNKQSYTHTRHFSKAKARENGYISASKSAEGKDGSYSVEVDNKDLPLTDVGVTTGKLPGDMTDDEKKDAAKALQGRIDALDSKSATYANDKKNLEFQKSRYE